MAVISVIKYEGDNNTLIWKHPSVDFNIGSQLIVHASQEAIFMDNGQIVDIYKAGRYTLNTQNLPIVKTYSSIATGFKHAYHCEVYFVNKTEQMSIKWGTNSKIEYIDPEFKFPISLGACGYMNIVIDNGSKLLVKVVGTEVSLKQEELIDKLKSFLMLRVKTILPQVILDNNINVFEIDQNMDIISEKLQEQLSDDFYDYGVKLISFMINNVMKPEEDRNYIKFRELYFRRHNEIEEAKIEQEIELIRKQTSAQGMVIEAEAISKKRDLEGYSYQQERSFDAEIEMAKNDAVAEFSNMGIGLGMITGASSIGTDIGNRLYNTVGVNIPSDSSNNIFCKKCGARLNIDSNFCQICGHKVSDEEKCKKCGHVFANDENFCPKCGEKRGV